jgi:hypothetical protein
MCDYSLHSIRSRPAIVGDRLLTLDFGTGTVGFAALDDLQCAVCLLPGTELSFSAGVRQRLTFVFWRRRESSYRTAIFRQVNASNRTTHHDALEFPDGRCALLTRLCPDQHATVLQLPASPKAAPTRAMRPQAVLP